MKVTGLLPDLPEEVDSFFDLPDEVDSIVAWPAWRSWHLIWPAWWNWQYCCLTCLIKLTVLMLPDLPEEVDSLSWPSYYLGLFRHSWWTWRSCCLTCLMKLTVLFPDLSDSCHLVLFWHSWWSWRSCWLTCLMKLTVLLPDLPEEVGSLSDLVVTLDCFDIPDELDVVVG